LRSSHDTSRSSIDDRDGDADSRHAARGRRNGDRDLAYQRQLHARRTNISNGDDRGRLELAPAAYELSASMTSGRPATRFSALVARSATRRTPPVSPSIAIKL